MPVSNSYSQVSTLEASFGREYQNTIPEKIEANIYIYSKDVCVSVHASVVNGLISEQNQWHIWNQQVPADVLAWF